MALGMHRGPRRGCVPSRGRRDPADSRRNRAALGSARRRAAPAGADEIRAGEHCFPPRGGARNADAAVTGSRSRCANASADDDTDDGEPARCYRGPRDARSSARFLRPARRDRRLATGRAAGSLTPMNFHSRGMSPCFAVASRAKVHDPLKKSAPCPYASIRGRASLSGARRH
jgi:hypothetical protein